MKLVICICAFLLSINLFGQQNHQGIRLFVYEITKTGKQLIPNGKVDVTINDSTQSLVRDDYGKINLIELLPGEYNVKITCKDCEVQETKGIEISENKIVYLSYELICKAYLESLSKKEKKQLGLQ